MGGRSVVARVELIKTTIRIVREAKIKKGVMIQLITCNEWVLGGCTWLATNFHFSK